MRKSAAAVGSSLFLALAPGTVAVLLSAFVRFVAEALGTPAPVAPTERLAVGARWYEEPDLARRFGADFYRYRAAVPGWRPRLRPWDPGTTAY